MSNFRGLAFGVLVISSLFVIFGDVEPWVQALSLASLAVFACLVAVHARVIDSEDEALRWLAVSRHGVDRCSELWKKFDADGSRFADPDHDYSGDLDLFGPSSLFQRISTAHTFAGQDAVAALLCGDADLAAVSGRQQAARALSRDPEFCQRFEVAALSSVEPSGSRTVGVSRPGNRPAATPDPASLLNWAETKAEVTVTAAAVWGSRLLPLMTVSALLAT